MGFHMATIRKRGDRYHVQIRRKGYPTQTKSFSDKKKAQTWAMQVESRIDLGTFLDFSAAETTTLLELTTRYKIEILPSKRSQQGVIYHLGHIEDIEFVGNMEKLYVRDEKTSELLMAYQTAEEAAQWSIGDNVYVGWEQEDEVTLN